MLPATRSSRKHVRRDNPMLQPLSRWMWVIASAFANPIKSSPSLQYTGAANRAIARRPRLILYGE